MRRPKRAAVEAPADRAGGAQAQAQGRRLRGVGHPAARPRHPGAADRRAGMEVHLFVPRPAALAAPGRRQLPSGWPTPARWRPRPCWRSPAARTRRPRSAPSAAPAPSPSWPCAISSSYAKKHNKSWRQADALVQRYLLPRWGKLQAGEHHARRRPRHDGPHRRSGAGQPGAGGGLSAIFSWAVEAGDHRRQSLPRSRAQRDQKPRARPDR